VTELKEAYHISPDSKVIGTGQYGKVFLAQSKADAGHQVAIKVLKKKALGQ